MTSSDINWPKGQARAWKWERMKESSHRESEFNMNKELTKRGHHMLPLQTHESCISIPGPATK